MHSFISIVLAMFSLLFVVSPAHAGNRSSRPAEVILFNLDAFLAVSEQNGIIAALLKAAPTEDILGYVAQNYETLVSDVAAEASIEIQKHYEILYNDPASKESSQGRRMIAAALSYIAVDLEARWGAVWGCSILQSRPVFWEELNLEFSWIQYAAQTSPLFFALDPARDAVSNRALSGAYYAASVGTAAWLHSIWKKFQDASLQGSRQPSLQGSRRGSVDALGEEALNSSFNGNTRFFEGHVPHVTFSLDPFVPDAPPVLNCSLITVAEARFYDLFLQASLAVNEVGRRREAYLDALHALPAESDAYDQKIAQMIAIRTWKSPWLGNNPLLMTLKAILDPLQERM